MVLLKVSDNGITRYISDGLGNVLAEIDGDGILQNKYVYGNGQKLVKLKRNNVVPVGSPFENNLETAGSMQDFLGNVTLTAIADHMEGINSVNTSIAFRIEYDSRMGFYMDVADKYVAQDYPYIHLWVKPMDNASWLEFCITDLTGGGTDWIQGDMDGDGKFEVGADLVANEWNELWLDVRNVDHQGHSDPGSGREVYGFCATTNTPASSSSPPIVFEWDHVFVTDEPYTVNYYHNDYLGSARVMTDASGIVVWSRDYYPFGGERSVTGTGNLYNFTGIKKDEEGGFYEFGYRDYFTDIGRWNAPDPLYFMRPEISPYSYVSNNPLRWIDILGLDWCYGCGENGEDIYFLEDPIEVTASAPDWMQDRISEHDFSYPDNLYGSSNTGIGGFGFMIGVSAAIISAPVVMIVAPFATVIATNTAALTLTYSIEAYFIIQRINNIITQMGGQQRVMRFLEASNDKSKLFAIGNPKVIDFGRGVVAGLGLAQTPTTDFGQRIMVSIMLYQRIGLPYR